MVSLSSIIFDNLGYVAVILMFINMLTLTILINDRTQTIVILTTFLLMIGLLPFLPPNNNQLPSIFVIPKSPIETFLFVGFSVVVIYLVAIIGQAKKSIALGCLLILAYPDLPIFPLIADIMGIISFVAIVKLCRQTKNTDFIAGIIVAYCLLLPIIPFMLNTISWKGILCDFRKQNITELISYTNRGIDSSELIFYSTNNIEDTPKRLSNILDILDTKQNGTYKFLEDSIAAFTLYRSSLQETALFDNTTFFENEVHPDVGVLTINKQSGHYIDVVQYTHYIKSSFWEQQTAANLDFSLIESSDTAMIFSASFDEINFKILCGFQNFLKSLCNQHISKSIYLQNKNNLPKVRLYYFDDDLYDLDIL